VVGREGIEGEDVLLGPLQRLADLGQLAVQGGDGLREPVASLGLALLVEDRPDQRRQGARASDYVLGFAAGTVPALIPGEFL